MNRRSFLAGSASLSGLAIAGCTTAAPPPERPSIPRVSRSYALMYGAMPQEQFPIPAIDLKRVPPQFYRREVDYFGPEPVGTVIVDTRQFYLFLVQENNRAMRYGSNSHYGLELVS